MNDDIAGNDSAGRLSATLWLIYALEIFAGFLWFPLAALSAMAYDSGVFWPAILYLGPFQAYPVLVLLGVGLSQWARVSGNSRMAVSIAMLPPVISFGSIGVVLYPMFAS